MRAFNAIARVVYILAIVGVIAFFVAGVVPASLEESPLDFEIGAECEYPVSDSEDILKENLRMALESNEGTLTVYEKKVPLSPPYIAYINPEDPDVDGQIDNAVNKIKVLWNTKPEARVVLIDTDENVAKQELRMMDSDEMSMHFYTEVTITNNLRYALKDINVGIDMLNGDNSVNYRILKSVPTTIPAGGKASIPIDFEVNMLNAVLVMMSGEQDSLDLYLGIDISGKYYFGLVGASIYATVKFSTSDELPAVSMTIEEHRIEVTINEKLDDDFIFDLPDDQVVVKIGDVTITLENDDVTGFSIVVDTAGGSSQTIIDALNEAQIEDGYYKIYIEIDGSTEEITISEEQFAQMLEIIEVIMEAAI